MCRFLLIPLFAAFAVCPVRSAQEPVRIVDLPWYVVEDYLEQSIAPVYPRLAQAAQVQGHATVYAIVSPDGNVVETFSPGDVPLLAQPADDAVRRWRFRPISVDGNPAIARAELVLLFYLDNSSATRAVISALRQGVRECRSLLDSQRYLDAEPVCSSLEVLAEKLPKSHAWERTVAHRLAGEINLARGRTSQALEAFSAAVKANVPGESRALSQLACARIYASTGDLQNAKRSFEDAEKTLRQLQKTERGRLTTPRAAPLKQWLDGLYSLSLQTVLRELVECLRQAGRTNDASDAQKRLERLVAEAVAK